MLTVTPSVVDAFARDRTNSMIERIARWLSGELGSWNGAPGTPGRRDLEEIVRLGTRSGMEVETDYALLAALLLTAPSFTAPSSTAPSSTAPSSTAPSSTGSPWRDLVAQPDIAAVLSGTDRNPPSKLLWLEARLEG